MSEVNTNNPISSNSESCFSSLPLDSKYAQKSIMNTLSYLNLFINSINSDQLTPEVINELKTISDNIKDVITSSEFNTVESTTQSAKQREQYIEAIVSAMH